MRNALLTLLLFGLLSAHATPAAFYEGLTMARMRGSAGAEPWTPADMTVQAWWDASDAATVITTGTTCVTNWLDKSGNSLSLTQTNLTLCPSNNATINGYPAIDFTENRLDTLINPFAPTVSNAYVIAVHKVDAIANGALFSLGTTNRWQSHCPWGTGNVIFDVGGGSGSNRIQAAYGVSAGDSAMPAFYCSTSENKQQVYKDGSLLVSDNTGHAVDTERGISVGGSAAVYQNTTIGEFIIINGTITDANRQKLEGYLAHKWGLAGNLPSDHPYKSAPPYKNAPDTWETLGLNTGLVSYWAMRTNTATTVFDEYGTNTATAVNGVLFGSAAGVRDDGADCTPATQNADLSPARYLKADSFPVLTNISMAAWVNYSGFQTSGGVFYPNYAISRWSNVAAGQYMVRVATNGTPNALFSIGGSPRSISGASSLSTGTWHHLCATNNGSTAVLYVNGLLVASSNVVGTIASTADPLNIGSRANLANPDFNFRGRIDEVPIWSRALSSNEVYQVYNTPLYAPYKP